MSLDSPRWPTVPYLDEADPLEHASGPTTAWTIVNAGEAMPGVMTPLGASFWVPSMEYGARAGYHDLGVLTGSQVTVPDRADERLCGVFAGRFAGNLDTIRMMADLMPGGSGNAAERQMFGSLREGVVDNSTSRRYPFVLVRGPVVLATLHRRMARQTQAIHAWWRARTTEDLTARPGLAPERLREAMGAVAAALRTHAAANMFVQAFSEAVGKLAAGANTPGLELKLLGGGGLEELALVNALWALAHGAATLEQVLAEFGFHGPDEGEISSRSWREDPAPLVTLTESYRSLPAGQSPQAREAARARERAEAEAALLTGCSRAQRGGAKLTLRLARAFTPLRELGKANFLKGIDAGRAAARVCGADLVRRGVLEADDDVFYLTAQEIVEALPAAPQELVARRRAHRERCLGLTLPVLWTGQAEPIEAAEAAPTVNALDGVAAAAGEVTGIARVITSAADCHELEPGEILVCTTTDPSWASVFPLAAALVIDIGGLISHGAIIARELGLPCVINTRTGTATIRTGDRLHVDGSSGHVKITERALLT
jgi:pyruvate,water dikinase